MIHKFFCPQEYSIPSTFEKLIESILQEAYKIPELKFVDEFFDEALEYSKPLSITKDFNSEYMDTIVKIAKKHNIDLTINFNKPYAVIGGQTDFVLKQIEVEIGTVFFNNLIITKDKQTLEPMIRRFKDAALHEKIHTLQAPNEKAAKSNVNKYVDFKDSKNIEHNVEYFEQTVETDAYAIQFASAFSRVANIKEVMAALTDKKGIQDLMRLANLSQDQCNVMMLYRNLASPETWQRFIRRIFEYYKDTGKL
jgi:hypothetical protein